MAYHFGLLGNSTEAPKGPLLSGSLWWPKSDLVLLEGSAAKAKTPEACHVDGGPTGSLKGMFHEDQRSSWKSFWYPKGDTLCPPLFNKGSYGPTIS